MMKSDLNKRTAVRLYHVDLYRSAQLNYYYFASSREHLSSKCEDADANGDHPLHCHDVARNFQYGTIVFSAFALEAMINFYALIAKVPHAKDVEKSMSTVNKWRIYPALVNAPAITAYTLERISNVFTIRDRIVHPKSKPENFEDGMEVFKPAHGAFVLNTVNVAAREIRCDVIPGKTDTWLDPDHPGERKPHAAKIVLP